MIKIIDTIIITALFFVLTIIATIYITYRKILRCIIVPSISLVDVSKDVQEKTKITFNDTLVKNLSSKVFLILDSAEL